MSQPQPAQYKITSIYFLETYFNRKDQFDLSKEITNKINIETKSYPSKENENNIIKIEVITEIKGMQAEDIISYECKMSTIGIFEKTGESDLNEDFFSNVNAPAIMFPFIREAFFALAMKSGIGNIYLPTINFVKKYKDSQPVQPKQE